MVMPVDCPLDPVQEQETSREGSQVHNHHYLLSIELSTNLHDVFTGSRGEGLHHAMVVPTIKLMGSLVNKVSSRLP